MKPHPSNRSLAKGYCVCRVVQDCALVRVASFNHLREAKKYMRRIAAQSPNSYVVFSEVSGVRQQPGVAAVFKLTNNSGMILSALDFGQSYMRVVPFPARNLKFERFSVQIGQRSFVVPLKQFVQDKCGGFTYHLPGI